MPEWFELQRAVDCGFKSMGGFRLQRAGAQTTHLAGCARFQLRLGMEWNHLPSARRWRGHFRKQAMLFQRIDEHINQ